MTFIDFFAGIGGFRRGLELAGHKCIGFCEYDKYATAAYTSMHLITEEQREMLKALKKNQRAEEILKSEYRNNEWYAADVRLVDGRNMPHADIFCFGAPCQDFSISGHRKGLDGRKSSLVAEIFRILEEQTDRPEWIIYENVVGMLSSNSGWDYFGIVSEMGRLGYDVEWQVLNSADFGVPQNRERVFTVGHSRRFGGKKILPLEGAGRKNSISTECINSKGGRGGVEGLQPSLQDRVYIADGISTAVTAAYRPKIAIKAETGIRQVGRLKDASRDNTQRYRVYEPDGIAPTLNTMGGGGLEPYIIGEVTQDKGAQIWYEPKKCYVAIRKLTPRECFRLQGWTDEYFDRAEFVCSDSQLYKEAGNGVTVNVVYEIAKRL